MWAALADPEVGARLLALARAVVRRPGVDHDDLVQTATLRALANSHKYDPDAGSVSAWLTGFVRNFAREQVKKRVAAPHTDGDLDRLPTRFTAEVEVADEWAALRGHLAALPELLRRAVELRHLEQLDYPAVAATLGVSEVTARQRVSRGIQHLRTLATREASCPPPTAACGWIYRPPITWPPSKSRTSTARMKCGHSPPTTASWKRRFTPFTPVWPKKPPTG